MQLKLTRTPGKFKVEGKNVVLTFRPRPGRIVVAVIDKTVNRSVGYAVLDVYDLAYLYREAASRMQGGQ